MVCDMVGVDAYYLLLGRSWQFNVDANHRGGIIYMNFSEIAKRIIRDL